MSTTPRPTPKAQRRDRKRTNKQMASAARAAEIARRKRQRTTRRFIMIGGAVASILILFAINSSKSSSDKKGATKATAANFATSCPSVVTQGPKTFKTAPKLAIKPDKKYTAKFDTELGSFTTRLDPKAAPNTVNSFVFLACQGFFDGVPFHRVVDNFVIQAGDPLCTDAELASPQSKCGQSGPGYTLAEEPPKDGKYPVGSLAMAKTGQPHSTGSQFFVVTGSPAALESSPTYSWFGVVTSGLDVAKKIEKQHTASTGGSYDGPPSPPVHIKKLRITESS